MSFFQTLETLFDSCASHDHAGASSLAQFLSGWGQHRRQYEPQAGMANVKMTRV